MLNTLSAKLAAVLLALLLLLGIFYIWLSLESARLHLQEVNQELNWTLAEHIVAEKILMEGRQVNQQVLEDLFKMLMVINPNIEIYLLDPEGKILACSTPPENLKRKSVSLEPIKKFLQRSQRPPILGDDPRDNVRRKVFSAALIPIKVNSNKILPGPLQGLAATRPVQTTVNSAMAGYLYVVLGGEQYESAAEMLQGSYILRQSLWVTAVSLLIALLAGVVLFRWLTRRLTTLSEAMETFKRSDFAEPVSYPLTAAETAPVRDEIDRLSVTFKEMAERIRQQVQGLQQTDALRRELVANVSHDLRTPLTSLQGYLETLLLKEGQLSAQEQRNYLEIATRQSERLGKLVGELFELAKLDAQVTALNVEPFALAELVQDVAQRFQLAAQQKGVTLRVEHPPQLPFVHADIGLIERVLANLIENALRYMPAGGRITLSLTPGVNTVKLAIADTGYGIPPEDLPYIFERFYRVEKTRREQSGGAGLGLAIAKRILDLHGSTIAVHSVINHGTVFSFELGIYRP
jgi:signal transduction histidine kinase